MEGSKMTRRMVQGAALAVLIGLAAAGCGPSRKISAIRDRQMSAGLSLAHESDIREMDLSGLRARRDTFTVHDLDGREVIIMKAVRDEEGEMVAHDVLDAAVVTARFRNVAERHGKVDISFNITVPEAMQDSRWQLRFYPDLFVLDDSTRLDPVLITGAGYRRSQLRGYELYERFLSSIVSDTTVFINRRQLEIFLHRNIPQVYAFRSDSSYVDEDEFRRIVEQADTAFSIHGVSKDQAVEHYTDKIARWLNRRRSGMVGRKYNEYVKAPIETEGIRLDTVMRAVNGDFVYCYTTTIATRPKLRKVDVVLSGDIWDQDRRIYDIPRSEPLTFYISSLSAFTDNSERYLTRVIERRAEANTACWIDFELGRDAVREDYGDNATEIARIRGNLRELLMNTVFDLDSVCVTASASPEGSWATNRALSQRRARSVSDYFNRYMREVQDSLDRDRGFQVDEDGNVVRHEKVKVPFISRAVAENWELLDDMVQRDSTLTDADRQEYMELASIGDPDRRERAMQDKGWYRHLREVLYPRVRTVRFDFHLHRKGMVKDTVHTTEIDRVYMEGVQAIRDRDYEKAVTLLRPYGDYNAAVAFVCMGYDQSALAILETLERSAQVNYMLSVLYSRTGRTQEAVQCYMHACSQEPSYVHRGNLDPEISALIRNYNLNAYDDDGQTE